MYFFCSLLLLFACHPSDTATIPMNPDAIPTYLALGDSYTIGESVPEADRWSLQLTDLLHKKGIALAKPDFIAQTGWTTSELADAIAASGNTKKYQLVSLLIGVNNQYRGQSTDHYRTQFRVLLKTAVQFADNHKDHVLVLSIPDWGVTPAGVSRNRQQIALEIDAFNVIALEECQAAGVVFVDITPESRTALNQASLVASDELHFSGKMYKLWAEKALPIAEKILR